MLVVGSPQSSNSVRLVETAKKHGCKSFLVPNEEHIPFKMLSDVKNIGITSGASVPEILTKKVVDALCKKFPEHRIENVEGKKENVVFKNPLI